MVTIVIPARNEEGVILTTLQDINTKIKVPYEAVVVNDGSTDKTEEVVRAFSRKHRNVRIASTKEGAHGFANALKLGFGQARGDTVVPVMADLCDDPKTINLMYKKFQEGWDIICGARYIQGAGKEGGPKLQGFLSRLVSLSLHYLTGVPTKDVSNAFKMYRKKILRNVKFNPRAGVEASMEITLQAYFNNAKITDVPTHWVGRKVGKSKFKLLQRAPRYLRIYLWALENSVRKRLGLRLKDFYVQ